MPECSFHASSQSSNLLLLLLLMVAVDGVGWVVLSPAVVGGGDGAEVEKLLQWRLHRTAPLLL